MKCVPFVVSLFLALAVSPVLSAHEIKVLASELFMEKSGEKTTVYLSWGHRLPIDDLVDAKSIDRYEMVSPKGETAALKTEGVSLQANSLEIKDEGLSQLVVTRKPGMFTTVIDEEGNRLLKRGPKSLVKEGKIVSAQRSVQTGKAMLVVGRADAATPKALGLEVELCPLDPANLWRSGSTLKFQAMLKGKPLPSANVVATYVGFRPDNAWCYSTSTGREGVASVRVHQPGMWVFKVNAKVPASAAESKDIDFTSYTATLALEVLP